MPRWAERALGVVGAVMAVVLVLSGAQAARAATVWTVQPTPDPVMANGQVQGLSCVTSQFCAAVGVYDNRAGAWGPLALTWDGLSWHNRNAVNPNPPGSGQVANFTGVSCLSASFCMAVGNTDKYGLVNVSGFAELWNGTSWHLVPFAVPAGSTGVNVHALSCVTSGFCEAVGEDSTTKQPNGSLAEIWNGTRWTVQPSPNQAGQYTSTLLTSVSCVSTRFCVAADDTGPLIERWNGTSWAPVTISGIGALNAVSCASATFCQATGWDNSGFASERWNGTTWQPATITTATTGRQLSAVSCRSAAFCQAVGYDNLNGKAAYYVAQWTGTSWRTRDVPGPGREGQGNALNAVACVSVSYCLAAGISSRPVQAEIFNGTSWSPAPVFVLDGAVNNVLNGVSCVSASFCEAVGDSGMNPSGLPEVWNGTSWKRQANSSLLGPFNAVSCVSAAFCEAIGSEAARWNGTAWANQEMPTNLYQAISCGSVLFCVAVGPLGAAIWSGKSWSATTLPDQNNMSYVTVSCLSATFCEAIGNNETSSVDPGIAARWNGTSWTTQPVPGPSGMRFKFSGVSCATTTLCELTGTAYTTGFTDGWNGTSWKLHGLLPAPPGFTGIWPRGLSCPTPMNCTLVGIGATSPTTTQAISGSWDGTTWTIQAIPRPIDSALSSVSCLANTPCEAVGAQSDDLIESTLAETTG